MYSLPHRQLGNRKAEREGEGGERGAGGRGSRGEGRENRSQVTDTSNGKRSLTQNPTKQIKR